jgi:hypothetical protein
MENFPESVGEAIDFLYSLRSERLEVEKQAKEIKDKESALEAYVILKLTELSLDGAKGHVATATITTSKQVIVHDWETLRNYIVQNDAWEMLQKRTSITAFRERWNEGVEIPGTEPYEKVDLSLVKAGRS